MAGSEAKKILTGLWADSGEREDPEDVDLVRVMGWPVSYEQIGSGKEPERTVVNQRFRELDGFASDVIHYGILPYDAEIDYYKHAFVVAGGNVHVSLEPNGPATGNVTDPDDSDQSVWRIY